MGTAGIFWLKDRPSVPRRVRLELFDRILERQLAAFQPGYFEIVGGRMRDGLVDRAVQVAMLALKFLKMGC